MSTTDSTRSSQSDYTLCPACNTPRVPDRFVGLICEFCHDEGRVIQEAPVNQPIKSTNRRKSVEKPSEPAQEASPEPYTPPKFDQAAAKANPAAELAARTLARRRLLPFIKRFRPKYDAGWVHEDICRRLERFLKDVEDGKEPRLLLLCPPRAGKSEIGSRHFPAWVLGQHPDWEIIAASNAMTLALSFSRYIRDLLRDPAYHAVFPDAILDPQSQSTENWNLTEGGGYLAAGVGSAIVGRGAHILCIDDIVRDMEAADSQLQRDAAWEWYITTAHSRLAPGGGVLGILTWWHEDDWAGRIQSAMLQNDEDAGGEQFEIVKYPAINDIGDEYILPDDSITQIPPEAPVPSGAVLTRPKDTALHPARYNHAALIRKKRNYIAAGLKRMWDSLYQQNPTPDEGIYFSKDMFRLYVHNPDKHGRFVYQAWDFAITEGAQNDWTVGVTLLQDEYDNLYVLDVLRFRTGDGNELIETMIDYYLQHDAQLIGVEDGQIWKALASQFKKRCEERKVYPSHEVLVPLTDKMVRANPLRGRMQLGKVYFKSNANWFPEYQRELLRFPAGKHDDCNTYDTLIECVHGQRQMGDLRDGDDVLTYTGNEVVVGKVSNHHCTGVKRVVELTFGNGEILKLTPSHPVLTERGYVYAGDLTTTDNIVRKSLCKYRNMASSGLKNQTGITSPPSKSKASGSGFTNTLMSKNAAKSQRVGRFITSIMTQVTTLLRTYAVYLTAYMPVNMGLTGLSTASHHSNSNICPTYEGLPQKLKKAPTPVRANFVRGSQENALAKFVRCISSLNQLMPIRPDIARINAATKQPTNTLKMFTRNLSPVLFVKKLLSPAHTESVTHFSVQKAAEIKLDTPPNSFQESVKAAKQPCTSQRGKLQATALNAEPPVEINTLGNAPRAGERFFPETLTAECSAIKHVLITPEDLRVTSLATKDTSKEFVRVVSTQVLGSQPTYNFDVEGTRNFIVCKGVVIHNCVDATAWAVRLTLSRSAPKMVQPAHLKSWKDKLNNLGIEGSSHMAA